MVHEVSATLSCAFLFINFIYGEKYLFATFFFGLNTFIFLGQELDNIDLLASSRFLGTPVVYFPVIFIGIGLTLHYLSRWGIKEFYKKLSSPADRLILFFLSWFLIVALYQGGFVSGLPYIVGYLFLWYFFRLERVIFANGISDSSIRALKWFLLLTLCSFFVSIFLNNHDPYFVPIRYLNRNCGVMILISFLMMTCVWIENEYWKKSLSWISFGLILTLIYLTQNRSGLLASFVFIGLIAWRYRSSRQTLISIALGLSFCVVSNLVIQKTVHRTNMEAESTLARFESFVNSSKMSLKGDESGKIEISTHDRLVHFQDALKVIRKKWFLGTGLGFNNYFRFEKLNIEKTPHNIFISYLAQMGIIGLLIFIAVHISLFGYSISTNSRYPFLAFVGAITIHLMFNEFYLQPYVWFLLGIIPSLPWRTFDKGGRTQSI